MKSVTIKISRDKLNKRIYEPYERIKTEKAFECSNDTFYDEAAEFLTKVYFFDKRREIEC